MALIVQPFARLQPMKQFGKMTLKCLLQFFQGSWLFSTNFFPGGLVLFNSSVKSKNTAPTTIVSSLNLLRSLCKFNFDFDPNKYSLKFTRNNCDNCMLEFNVDSGFPALQQMLQRPKM